MCNYFRSQLSTNDDRKAVIFNPVADISCFCEPTTDFKQNP